MDIWAIAVPFMWLYTAARPQEEWPEQHWQKLKTSTFPYHLQVQDFNEIKENCWAPKGIQRDQEIVYFYSWDSVVEMVLL